MHKAQQQRILDTPEKKEHRRRLAYKTKLKEYGMTLEEFDQMLVEQDNRCKICRKTFDPEVYALKPHVDHCHAGGNVRGVLCFSCNVGLGKFYDNIDFLKAAITYLEG